MTGARCKTCGGEPPNHRPSMFDPEGIGDPGHKMPKLEEATVIGDDGLIEATATLYPGQTMIELPADIGRLLYLNIDGAWIREIRGRWLTTTPENRSTTAKVIVQYYPRKKNKNVKNKKRNQSGPTNEGMVW